jgi:hypothetical protein
VRDTGQEKVPFSNTIVAFVIFPNGGEHHAYGELCDGFWRVGGNVDHFDPEGLSLVEVDVVCAGTLDMIRAPYFKTIRVVHTRRAMYLTPT